MLPLSPSPLACVAAATQPPSLLPVATSKANVAYIDEEVGQGAENRLREEYIVRSD